MKTDVAFKKFVWISGLLLMLGVTVAAHGFHGTADGRGSCPGTVVCPLTGEEVCRDQRPLIDSTRSDCPGKVECPLTGELICRDQCPLNADQYLVDVSDELPACCRGRQ